MESKVLIRWLQHKSAWGAADSVTSLQTMCMLIEKTCSCDGLIFFFLFLRIPWIFAMRVYTASRSTFPSYGVEFCFSAVGPAQVFKVWDSDRASGNGVSGLGEKQEEGRRGEKQPTNAVLLWGQEKQSKPKSSESHCSQSSVNGPSSCFWSFMSSGLAKPHPPSIRTELRLTAHRQCSRLWTK